MSKLKIGFVFDDSLDKPDGVQQFVLTLGEWLASQGHDVHYLVGQTKRRDIPKIHSLSKNMNVRFNKNRMAMPLPTNTAKLRQVLQRENFDILHIQVPYSPFLAGKIIRLADPQTAVVGTYHIAPHSKLVTIANQALGLWVRRSLERFDAITATSQPASDFAKKTMHIKSQVVALPLKLDDFYRAKPFERYQQALNVVFLGRLVERKGCQYLLQAVAYLHRQGQWPEGARLLICGKGHLEAEMKKYAADNNLDGFTEFTGFITEADKPRYLASSDIAVYPSTGGESFGIVLLEAMASSRGVVLAGDNPGYASVMAPRPESIFEPTDTEAFAKKISKYLGDANARHQANEWQKDYVRQFDVSRIGERFLHIYTEALHKRRA